MKNNILKFVIIFILIIIEALLTINFSVYTADIINNGLIKKGIDLSIPFFVDEEYMNILEEYFDTNNELKNYYTFVSKNDIETFKKYKITRFRNIYILNENINEKEVTNKVKTIVEPIIISQNFHVKFKINKILKENLSSKQYDEITKAFDAKNIYDVKNLLNDEIVEKIREVLTNEKYKLDDIVYEQAINEYNQYEYNLLGIDLDANKLNYIYKDLRIIILMIVLLLAIQVVTVKISLNITGDICMKIRNKIANKILRTNTKELKDYGITKLYDSIINSTNTIETSLPIVIKEFIYAPVVIVYGIYLIIKNTNFTVAFLIISSIILSAIITLISMLIIKSKAKECETKELELGFSIKNVINGLPVVRSFLMEELETIKFKDKTKDLSKKYKVVNNVLCAIIPVLIIIMSLSLGTIFYEGIKLVDSGKMHIGNIIQILQISIHVITAFFGIAILCVLLRSITSSLKEIKNILKIKEQEDNGSIILEDLKSKEIKFNNVCYKENNNCILENINFNILPGKINAIIGKNGSGKTTVIDLLLRNISCSSGEILINGNKIEEYTNDSFKKMISISTQENYIFSGTIEENLKLSNQNISKEKMNEIIKTVFLEDLKTEENSNILDFKIINGGANISGGQKQRIAIANAIAKDFDLLILDDSFSSLDTLTTSKIKENLKEICSNKTVIIVSQKVSDVKIADNIIVLDNGKFVMQGNHEYLKNNCEEYKDFINIQAKEEA